MAQELADQALEFSTASDHAAAMDPALSRMTSSSQFNPQAPEFVPRAGAPMVKIPHQPTMIHVIHGPLLSPGFVGPVVNHGTFEYCTRGFGGEQEAAQSAAVLDPDHTLARQPPPPARDGLSDEVVQKKKRSFDFCSFGNN